MEELASYYGFSYTSKTVKAILQEALVPQRSLHLQKNTNTTHIKPRTKPSHAVKYKNQNKTHVGRLVVPQTERYLVKPLARSSSPIFLLYLRLVSNNPHQNKNTVYTRSFIVVRILNVIFVFKTIEFYLHLFKIGSSNTYNED